MCRLSYAVPTVLDTCYCKLTVAATTSPILPSLWVNAAQFVAYLFFGPETRYIRQGVGHSGSAFKREYFNFSRIDPTPLRLVDFIQPLFLAKYPTIVIATLSYTFVFGFCSVFLTVEIPQIFIPKFGFSPQPLGLQFLGVIIGSVIGEQLAGPLSDFWMNRKTKRLHHGSRPHPEYRLYLSYFGFLLSIVGIIIFGVRTEQAAQGEWNVTPIVGIAIAAVGNQIVTAILITYMIDRHMEHSSSIGVFVNVIRSTWGFIGPFWFPYMIDSLGTAGSGGLMAGIVALCSWAPIVVLQWKGTTWRKSSSTDDPREDDGRRGD